MSRATKQGSRSARRRRSQPPARAAKPRWPVWQVPVVVAAAAAMRALTWWLYSRTPFFDHPVVDASFFRIWAQNIAAGHQFQPDVFFKPPLYAYLLAWLYQLFGQGQTAVYVLQSVLGIGSCVLVLAIGRTVFAPTVALIGALFCALLPMLPFFELQLLAETLTTFLSLTALLLVLQSARNGRFGSLVPLALAGAALGVAALGRPNLLVLPPLLAFWILRRRPADGQSVPRALHWRSAGALLLGAMLAIAPVTLRNWRVSGELVPVCANFGVNLWTGHHRQADGISAVPVGIKWDDLKLRCEQAGAGRATASSRYLRREAVREILDDPLRAVGLLIKKSVCLLAAHEIRNNIGASFLAREQGVFVLGRWWPGFWLLAPLALVGLWRAKPYQWEKQILLIYLLAIAVSLLPFFVTARFRAPLLPVLALFAAVGAVSVRESVRLARGGRLKQALPVLAVLLAGFLLVNVDWYDLNDPRFDARDQLNLAAIHAGGHSARTTDLQAAAVCFQEAMALDDRDPDIPERYGQHLLSLAQPFLVKADHAGGQRRWRLAAAYADSAARIIEKALPLHRRAASLYPRSFRSHANVGSCRLWLADRHVYRMQLALAEGDSTAGRTEAAAALNGYGEAWRAYDEALSIWPAFPEAKGNLQLCLERIMDLPPVSANIVDYQSRLRQELGVDNTRN